MNNFHGKFVTFRIREVTFARKHKEKHVFLWCFAHLFVTLHKICARTGCTSAKSKLSALGLHRPCHTPFHKGTTLYCSISPTNCDLERDLMSKSKCTLKLRTIAQTSTIVHLGLSQACRRIWDGAALSLCPYR